MGVDIDEIHEEIDSNALPTSPSSSTTKTSGKSWKELLFTIQKVVAAMAAIAGAGWGFYLWLRPSLPAHVALNLPSCTSQLIEVEALNTGGQSVPVGPPRFRIETPRRGAAAGSSEHGRTWDLDNYLEERETLGPTRRVPPQGADRQPGLVKFRYPGGGDEFFSSDEARHCRIYVVLPVEGQRDVAGSCPCAYP